MKQLLTATIFFLNCLKFQHNVWLAGSEGRVVPQCFCAEPTGMGRPAMPSSIKIFSTGTSSDKFERAL